MGHKRQDIKPVRPEIDASVFQAITCAVDMFKFEEPLLPNLREISCEDIEGDTLWNMYPFLCSRLQRFWMHIHQPPGPATMTILSALGAKSPRIAEFIIHGSWSYNGQLMPHISLSLCRFSHLRSVCCAEVTLTHRAIFHLASLPNLCEIDIRVSDDQIGICPSLHTPFPALRSLSLNGESITASIDFVQKLIRSASLKSFNICVNDCPTSAQLGQIITLLVAHSLPEYLKDINFSHPDYISYGDHSPPLLDPADLAFLMKFPNLECISLETECSIVGFDDNLLEAMAMSWPKLHHLRLTNGLGNSLPSRCTLHGMLLLVQHCPNLMTLRIVFQSSAEIGWNGRPGGGIVNEHVHELEVGESPISDPRAVASFLSDIFPNLTSIMAWDNFDPDDVMQVQNRERWQEAIELFHSFVAIRKEERAWAAAAGRNEQEMKVD